MSSRLDAIRARAEASGAASAVVTHLADIRWAVGFTGSNGVLVVTPEAAHFVTDGRYSVQARREVTSAEVHVPGYQLWEHIAESGWLRSASGAAFQSDHMTVQQRQKLDGLFGDVRWVPVAEMLVEDVAAKTPAEVEAVRQAQALTCEVFVSLLPLLQSGITEQEIATHIITEHLKRGASQMAFEPIVGSGPNGALPHARAGSRALQAGDLVVIDMGGYLDGYASDLTRTVAIGEPGEEARAAYAAVLAAQEAAIAGASAGVTGAALDALARGVLDDAGLAEYFTHSLGHGVGLDVHEWPRLSSAVQHVLPEGATVTIEPGVYVPDRFGLRIEDIIALTSTGCDNLTPLAKDLLVL
ncbi:M24 family metallopeptidase [Rubricoccus marinus]|uniref:Aminopeptidase n=1 Tax=Rubricoccus marinus TaxID=716817 RepID=A0A259TYX7_9BACT|nr:Xaa-Pro peptidase family protein [Rubricoccus marinus]OZC02788.1 aminopeptidase [Rubricoccus marinus]